MDHLEEILETKDYVIGEIYMMKNIITGKKYIGQTVSHRLNHGKYRPYGYKKRFDSHLSEARCRKGSGGICTALDNSIREHGIEKFELELLLRCKTSELDMYEKKYIKDMNTLYPNGLNLTKGGKDAFIPPEIIIEDNGIQMERVEYSHSEETKAKLSKRAKAFSNKEETKNRLMKNSQNQHDSYKLSKYSNLKIDHSDPEYKKYIFPVISKETNLPYFVKVKIDSNRIDFMGKHQDFETIKNRAISFLEKLQ